MGLVPWLVLAFSDSLFPHSSLLIGDILGMYFFLVIQFNGQKLLMVDSLGPLFFSSILCGGQGTACMWRSGNRMHVEVRGLHACGPPWSIETWGNHCVFPPQWSCLPPCLPYWTVSPQTMSKINPAFYKLLFVKNLVPGVSNQCSFLEY